MERFRREAGVRRLGLEHGSEGLRIRCDGQAVTSASLLAKELPLVLLTPESQRLMTEGASLRRQLLDWCLFHVEPGFLPVFKRFRRVLKQRNAALRSQESPRAVRSWDEELIVSGNEVHELRARYVDVFLPTVEAIVDRLLPFRVALESTGQDGRKAVRFEEALGDSLSSDVVRGFTQVGPQRGDVAFLLDGVAARKLMSRGEVKLFVAGIMLAQAAHFIEHMGRGLVIMVDEVASELDEESRRRIFSVLGSLGVQTFVTTVSRGLVENGAWLPDAVFHVEQGKVSAVV